MANRFSIEAVFKTVDRVTAPVSRMQNRINKFTRSAAAGMRRLNQSVTRFTSAVNRAGRVAVAGLTVVMTAGIFAINRYADSIDELAKRSRRLGFPIDELQEWEFVATQAGLTSETFNDSLDAFTKRLGEAKKGFGPIATSLKKFDRQLLKNVLNSKNSAEAFELIVQAMRDAPDAATRAALASAAFSRSGLKFANIADISAKAVKKLRLEQQRNGLVTTEQAEAAEAYNDSVDSLMRSLNGLRIAVFSPLFGTMTRSTKQFREFVLVNRELIGQNISGAISFITDNFKQLLTVGKGLLGLWLQMIAVNLVLKAGFLLTAIVMRGVWLVQKALWATGMLLRGSVIALTVGYNLLRIGMIALHIATSPMLLLQKALAAKIWLTNLATKAWQLAIVTITAVTKAWTIATFLLGAVLSKTPFGVVLKMIGLLAAGAALVVANWDSISGFFSGLWDDVVGIFERAMVAIKPVIDAILTPVRMLFSGLESLSGLAGFKIDLPDFMTGSGATKADVSVKHQVADMAVAKSSNVVPIVQSSIAKQQLVIAKSDPQRMIVNALPGTTSELQNLISQQSANDSQLGMVTPQERTVRQFNETRQTSETTVVIKDETGRAEIEDSAPAAGVDIQIIDSVAFG